MTSVLLSIKPQFAGAILAGLKRVEFRRQAFAKPVDKVFLYSTGSRGAVVGMFAVRLVNRLSPRQAWKRYRKVACISRRAFFEYFAGSRVAICIEVRRASKARRPVARRRLGRGFSVPQSFRYLTSDKSRRLEKALGVARPKRAPG